MNGTIIIEDIIIRCPDCGKEHSMKVTNAPNGMDPFPLSEFRSYVRSLLDLGKTCSECNKKKWGMSL